MQLVVVGTVAFDSVETPAGRRDRILGGSANYCATAASFFCRPGIVSIIGDDFPEAHLEEYRRRNIDTQGIERRPGKTFFWEGRYGADPNVAHTLETQLNVLLEFDPQLPEAYRAAPFAMLGNIAPELQLRVVRQLHAPKLIAADTMNYWIKDHRPKLLEVLRHVQLLSVNDQEARQLSGEHSVPRAAAAIRRMGPKIVAVKRGEHGATLYSDDGVFVAPAFPVAEVRDPTGAGDSFAGGLMGFLAKSGEVTDLRLRQAAVVGSCMASFAVEDFSSDALRALTLDRLRERLRRFADLTRFEANIL